MNNKPDAGVVTDNITWSEELIETLEKTTRTSEHIVQRVKAFHETQKMLENSRYMSMLSQNQVRRSRIRS